MKQKYFIVPGIVAILIGYLMSFTIRGKKKGRLKQKSGCHHRCQLLDACDFDYCPAFYIQWKI